MARLRYNGLTATLGADLLTAGTTITFTGALTHAAGAVPTIGAGDYIPLAILDATGRPVEIVHLTAYTTGTTTGTVTRAQESTIAADRATGSTVVNGITAADATEFGAAAGVRAYRSAAQSIPNNTVTTIDFDAESYDTHAFRNATTNRSRLTVPAGMGGLYFVSGVIRYAANATGTRTAGIAINGSTYSGGTDVAIDNNGALPTGVTVVTTLYLVPGDYVELVGYQSSGGALSTDTGGSNQWTHLAMFRVGS